MINKKLLYPFLLFITGFIFLQNMYSQENDLTDDKNPAGNNAIAEDNDTIQQDFLEKKYKNFLYTYSDAIIPGDKFIVGSDNGIIYFQTDSFRVKSDAVKFFKFNDNFWANTEFIDQEKNSFALRIQKGKINLFRKVYLRDYSSFYSLFIEEHTLFAEIDRDSRRREVYYYNIGYGDLRYLKYINLKRDLYSSKNSLQYLKKYRNAQVGCSILILAGITSMVYGISYDVRKNQEANINVSGTNLTPFLEAGLGIISIWTGINLSSKNTRYLKKAVEVY